MNSTTIRIRLVLLLVVLSAAHSTHAEWTQICPLGQIQGFEKEYELATRFLGKDLTEDMRSVKVHIQVTNHDSKEYLYVQTTYRPQKSVKYNGESYLLGPRKGFRDTPLAHVTDYMNDNLFDSDASKFAKDHFVYFVDASVFGSSKFRNLSLLGVAKSNLVFPDGSIRETITLQDHDGATVPFYRVSEANHGWLFRRFALDEQSPSAALHRHLARAIPHLHIAMLVNNRKTSETFRKKIPANVRIDVDAQTLNRSTFVDLVRRCRDGLLVISAHLESNHVMIYSNDRQVFAISVSEVEAIAMEHSVDLLLVGCGSASVSPGVGIGGESTIQSTDVVDRLAAAVSTSCTYMEFLERLSSDTFRIVIPEILLNIGGRLSMSGDIYERVASADDREYSKRSLPVQMLLRSPDDGAFHPFLLLAVSIVIMIAVSLIFSTRGNATQDYVPPEQTLQRPATDWFVSPTGQAERRLPGRDEKPT